MTIAEFIRDNVLHQHLKQSGCLVVYDQLTDEENSATPSRSMPSAKPFSRKRMAPD